MVLTRAHSESFTKVNPLKLVSYKQQNFCLRFWTPRPNLDWFGVSCWVRQSTRSLIRSHLELHNCCLVFLLGTREAKVSLEDATLWRSQWLSSSETPSLLVWKGFECDKWYFGSGRDWVGADANFIVQLLVSPFLKALAALRKQNCPHKDRKLSNRGIAPVHQPNVARILNNNFKT